MFSIDYSLVKMLQIIILSILFSLGIYLSLYAHAKFELVEGKGVFSEGIIDQTALTLVAGGITGWLCSYLFSNIIISISNQQVIQVGMVAVGTAWSYHILSVSRSLRYKTFSLLAAIYLFLFTFTLDVSLYLRGSI